MTDKDGNLYPLGYTVEILQMKKKTKFLLWLLPLLLIAIIVGIFFKKKVTVDPVYIAMTSSTEEVENDWLVHQESEKKFLEDYQITVTPPTAEQNEALLNGLTTAEEVKQALGLTESADSSTADAAPDPSAEPVTPQALVDECVSKLYILRIDLIAQLGALRAEAINTWEGYSEGEQNGSQKTEIVIQGLRQCSELEIETDDKVDALLEEYRGKLSALGADTAVIDQLWLYYCDDKAATKAYYLNQYL